MGVLLDHPTPRRHGLSFGVVRRFERQIKNESVPVLEKLITWTNLLSFVLEAEELLLDDDQNAELREIHHGLTETSIVLGESLLKEAGIEQALQQLSCKVEDLQAKIRMLRYKDRMWHGDVNSEKAEKALKDLFGGIA